MTEKDRELLQVLFDASSSGRLAWQETAKKGEFTTSLEGRFNAAVARPRGDAGAVFELRDLEDRLLLRIWSSDSALVDDLYELARRSAFHVDDAVEDALRLLRGP
jgi:hypothetical protein